MTPNRRRGFKRLAVVYFVLVILLGVWGWHLQSFASEGFVEALRSGQNVTALNKELTFYNDLSEEGARYIKAALLLGFVVPIVGGICFWIYRGFKPKSGE